MSALLNFLYCQSEVLTEHSLGGWEWFADWGTGMVHKSLPHTQLPFPEVSCLVCWNLILLLQRISDFLESLESSNSKFGVLDFS